MRKRSPSTLKSKPSTRSIVSGEAKFRMVGLGFGVWGLGFRARGSGCRV